MTLHKPYQLPELPLPYTPIQVGYESAINSTFLRDDMGDNISEKNSTFCELTALYWAWKNLDADITGLCHYRRYLGSPSSFFSQIRKGNKNVFLGEQQIRMMLKDHDIILPKKRHYWIETRGSHYAHAHHVEDLRVTEGIIQEKYPSFLSGWRKMLSVRSGHICNMFIMRKVLLDEYCAWLFDILFEVEKRLDISSYSEYDRRVFGFLGERLLDVWVETNKLQYKEVPVINLEDQHWLHKGIAFIRRKFAGKPTNEI